MPDDRVVLSVTWDRKSEAAEFCPGVEPVVKAMQVGDEGHVNDQLSDRYSRPRRAQDLEFLKTDCVIWRR